jgi:hypothetical protein
VASLGAQPADGAADAVGPQVIVERPPPGLARGEVAWPAWAVATLGIAAVMLGIAYLVWRLRGLRRR